MGLTPRGRFSTRCWRKERSSSASYARTRRCSTCHPHARRANAVDRASRARSSSLAKRAAHLEGWQSITNRCRGVEVTRDDKTFLALSHLAHDLIRVVLVRFDDVGWIPYFCTDSNATVRDILEAAADRWAIEEHFHEINEVWGADQQKVRNIWSNIVCWHLNQWLHTLMELASWDESSATRVDRSSRPWDNAHRCPSHRDRRCKIAADMLRTEFPTTLPTPPKN